MSVLFLSDRDDPIMRGAYECLSKRYPCQYGGDKTSDPDIIIANHCINPRPGKKIVYYATTYTIPNDLAARRQMLNWLKNCDVVCSSWVMAKLFHDIFRLKPTVQHPCVVEQDTNQVSIYYSNKFSDINAIRNELPTEEFVQLEDPYDIAGAKVYLASSPAFLDLALCVASSCGVPVVSENSPHVQEFLDVGDVVLGPNTPLNLKIQTIKKTLKECNNLKKPSNKFLQAPVLEDKIKQALSKKPTNRDLILTPKKVDNNMKVRQRQHQGQQVELFPTQKKVLATGQPINSDTVWVSGTCMGFSGYDLLVKEVIRGLKSIDVDVRINHHYDVKYNICPAFFKDVHCVRPNNAWEIVIVPPCSFDRVAQPLGKKSVVFTMWETDRIEPHWVKLLNSAAFVCVPSQFGVDTFKSSGVKIPIYKVPLGFDPVVFNYDGSYPLECTFGTAAALTAGGIRKNTNHIVNLFQKAFPNNEKVKLKVKIMPSCPWTEVNDQRVELTKALLTTEQLASWYRSIGVFVNGSYAEGFGLHLIETMACGRPIISTAYSAVTEYFDDTVGYTVDHEVIKASGEGKVPYYGHWGKPIDESVIKQMRWVYEHRDEAQTKGHNAAIRAKAFTWKMMGQRLFKILKENGVIA